MARGNHFVHIEVDFNTIGQYTGLRDKNRNKIYEGDIVKVRDLLDIITTPFQGVVGFQDGSFMINQIEVAKHYRWEDYACEVIGNIYDNKNLLED